MSDSRPVLFVTNYAPDYRIGAFSCLHGHENILFALIGGRVRHGGMISSESPDPDTASLTKNYRSASHPLVSDHAQATESLPFPARHIKQRDVYTLAASGKFRAVIAGLSGRVAVPAAYMGARTARVPFLLWTGLWAHPRTLVHRLSYLPTRHIYRNADALITYGSHVSRYLSTQGVRNPVFIAPQSVDNDFWSQAVNPARHGQFQVLFSGRVAAEKGVKVLFDAWRAAEISARGAVLVVAGEAGGQPPPAPIDDSVIFTGPQSPQQLRQLYAGSDLLVLPSLQTRDFCEPWGLVVNEAFNQGVPALASDQVGAVAGGLVTQNETGLVVQSNNASALSSAFRLLCEDTQLRKRLGSTARTRILQYSHENWAKGVAQALAAVGKSAAVKSPAYPTGTVKAND